MPRDNSPPAFMFYVDDFASDGKVEAMCTEAVGCYILLLCKAWRENPPATIPDNDCLLARWARVSDDRWNSLRTEVLQPFDPAPNGRLVQKRLRREYEKQIRNRRARIASGKLGAEARWHANGKCYGDGMAKESESESEDESESSFDRFWSLYPRKVGKRAARVAWTKAIKVIRHETLCSTAEAAGVIDKATEQFAKSDKAKGDFCPHPATWLNQGRYEDDPQAWQDRKPQSPKIRPLSERGK